MTDLNRRDLLRAGAAGALGRWTVENCGGGGGGTVLAGAAGL